MCVRGATSVIARCVITRGVIAWPVAEPDGTPGADVLLNMLVFSAEGGVTYGIAVICEVT